MANPSRRGARLLRCVLAAAAAIAGEQLRRNKYSLFVNLCICVYIQSCATYASLYLSKHAYASLYASCKKDRNDRCTLVYLAGATISNREIPQPVGANNNGLVSFSHLPSYQAIVWLAKKQLALVLDVGAFFTYAQFSDRFSELEECMWFINSHSVLVWMALIFLIAAYFTVELLKYVSLAI